MKIKFTLPVTMVTLLLLVVLVGCTAPQSTPQATQTPYVIVVTPTPEKVAETAEPTEPPATPTTEIVASGDSPKFFRDEFESDLDDYQHMLWTGRFGKDEVYIEDGILKFRLDAMQLAPYLTYVPHTYSDVRIETQAENLGYNDNHITLVCRFDEERGWYEFNISSSGLYRINYYDAILVKNYVRLANGGSNDIKLGREINTVTAECIGDQLSLYVNGVLLNTVEHRDLKEGRVGLGVSSFEYFPVNVDFEYLEINQP